MPRERVLEHKGNNVREFYSSLEGPVCVGIEATGAMQQWFLELMEKLDIESRVGNPAKVRAHEPRKQNDRRDAKLLLDLLVENRFPAIWMPSLAQRDVRALLRYRHQWVRIRTRLQNALQSIALNHGLRRGSSLWSKAGFEAILNLPLSKYASQHANRFSTSTANCKRTSMRFEYRPLMVDGRVVSYTSSARPLEFEESGRYSFLLAADRKIHQTREDRDARLTNGER